jgi:hypothetical protein
VSIILKSKKPENAKTWSKPVIHHIRRYSDSDDYLFDQHGGVTAVYQLEAVSTEKCGRVLMFRAGIAVCRHDEVFNRKLGVQLATKRLIEGTNPYVVTGLIPTDNRTIEVDFSPDGMFYVTSIDDEPPKFFEVVEDAVDQHLRDHVWTTVFSNPNNPLARGQDSEPKDGEPDEDEDGMEDDDDEDDDEESPIALVVVGSDKDLEDEENEDEDEEDAASSGSTPIKH